MQETTVRGLRLDYFNIYMWNPFILLQVKVHRYWPAKQPANIGTLVVEMTNEMVYEDYTMREIKLTNTKVSLLLPNGIKYILRVFAMEKFER